jgi:hypothetical protein
MELCTIIRFLTFKKLSTKDVKMELDKVYDHEALCLLLVKK